MTEPDDVKVAAELAAEAADLLVGLRKESFDAGLSAREVGDRGDRESNRLLLDGLARLRPADAVLSEEAVDDPRRLEADRVWIIDPLDGTREYSEEGRPDWAVHVALWERGAEITAAAVALPALGSVLTSAASAGGPTGTAAPGPEAPTAASGPEAGNKAILDPPPPPADGPLRVVVSRSRPPAWLDALGRRLDLQLIPMGSAGFKAMAVLRGEADVYLHSGGQYEWDSAAPVGVLHAAGLHASRLDGSPLLYNQPSPYLPDLLVCRSSLLSPLLAALEEVEAK
ncbi:MAG TPA: 3'(2'),5'-bisphosphate nucleotidase CysQ [Acidimicrobiales bacterium]|nr:3'(2'),5'-bisphosphate nucleotidase CysQ [Acidimicrobiales bacterium]